MICGLHSFPVLQILWYFSSSICRWCGCVDGVVFVCVVWLAFGLSWFVGVALFVGVSVGVFPWLWVVMWVVCSCCVCA